MIIPYICYTSKIYNYSYPVTLISSEVIDEISQELGFEVDPKLFRRNIIISGIHLNSLIGKKFYLDDVLCEGIAHCAPCTWMDAVIAKGTYKLVLTIQTSFQNLDSIVSDNFFVLAHFLFQLL